MLVEVVAQGAPWGCPGWRSACVGFASARCWLTSFACAFLLFPCLLPSLLSLPAFAVLGGLVWAYSLHSPASGVLRRGPAVSAAAPHRRRGIWVTASDYASISPGSRDGSVRVWLFSRRSSSTFVSMGLAVHPPSTSTESVDRALARCLGAMPGDVCAVREGRVCGRARSAPNATGRVCDGWCASRRSRARCRLDATVTARPADRNMTTD